MLNIRYNVLVVLLCLASTFFDVVFADSGALDASSSVNSKQIMLAYEDPHGGGADYMPAKGSTTSPGSVSMLQASGVLINVLVTHYSVDANVKFVKAEYVICTGKSPRPINVTVELPIANEGAKPSVVPLAAGFSAYAQFVEVKK